LKKLILPDSQKKKPQSKQDTGGMGPSFSTPAVFDIISKVINFATGGGGPSGETLAGSEVIFATFINDFERFLGDFLKVIQEPTLENVVEILGMHRSFLFEIMPVTYLIPVLMLIGDVVDMTIHPLKFFLDAIIELIMKFIPTLAKMLSETFEIPFISTLYEFFTTLLGEEEKFRFDFVHFEFTICVFIICELFLCGIVQRYSLKFLRYLLCLTLLVL
jgi:hypothetical protein